MTMITSIKSWRTSLVLGLMIILLGCAPMSITQIPTYSSAEDIPSEELRLSFGNIAIVPLYEPPNIELNETVYSKSGCAKEGAASGMDAVLSSCQGEGCLVGLILAPIFAGVGAIAGAAEADSEEEVKSRLELIQSKTDSSGIKNRFHEKAVELSQQYNEYSFLADPTPKSTEYEQIPFELLREQQVDTILQLGITHISSEYAEAVYCDPELRLIIETSLALINVADGKQILLASMHRGSEARKLEDWAKLDAKFWDEALGNYVEEVTTGLFDDVFLHVKAPAQIVPTQNPSEVSLRYVRLSELRPTFAWAWDPDISGSWTGELSRYNSDLIYDLRVTSAWDGSVLYEKSGITETQHTLEERLPRQGFFEWQIRANFLLDGKSRRTRWLGNFKVRTRRGKGAWNPIPLPT